MKAERIINEILLYSPLSSTINNLWPIPSHLYIHPPYIQITHIFFTPAVVVFWSIIPNLTSLRVTKREGLFIIIKIPFHTPKILIILFISSNIQISLMVSQMSLRAGLTELNPESIHTLQFTAFPESFFTVPSFLFFSYNLFVLTDRILMVSLNMFLCSLYRSVG